MASKWITKKSKSGGNIHIPIRKTFEIPKEKAIIDVQTLKEEGMKNEINYIKEYIKKHGPINALRVSSAGNVMARNGFYDGYYDVVSYEIRLNKKDQIVAYPIDSATRKYSSRNKAIKIANNLATAKNAVIITHLGILDNENEIKNIFFYLKNKDKK
jgi:hypothetical protein